MARNSYGTHSDLIHCDNCGEDYSSTYKRCPFCGARPSSSQSGGRGDYGGRRASGGGRVSQDSRSRQPVEEDEYTFDGQDVFDEVDRERGRGGSPFWSGGGGRHLSDDGQSLSPTTIIGFVVSGIIVLAAILIVVLVILPMIKGGRQPAATNSANTSLPGTTESQTISPSPSITDPTPGISTLPTDPSVPTDPTVTDDPGTIPSDPSATSSQPVTSTPPATGGFNLTYNGKVTTGFSISDQWPAPIQLQASGASGTVTWKSDNPAVATVSASGLVTGVSYGDTYITATDSAGRSQDCHVIVRLSKPAVSSAPAPSASASSSPAPSASASSGSLSLSRDDFTLNSTWPTYTFTVTGASGTVTWSSSNTGVATVDANGKVTMVGKGQCRVTATDAAGNSASCIVRCS